ncbi:hypothetical protein [Corynebacterium uterequi]|uniref:Uncharacterized protein n=1 Tax=Corynebacterium uterequi TaxID=1072256 RepID=A0A0G3HH00_9CORY|nr:hypothetical protein [Corynebacterium uterequi]AKK10427.1 hypothetical protein CUTER_02060 [Corynebacterium uterequi]
MPSHVHVDTELAQQRLRELAEQARSLEQHRRAHPPELPATSVGEGFEFLGRRLQAGVEALHDAGVRRLRDIAEEHEAALTVVYRLDEQDAATSALLRRAGERWA